VGRGHGGTRDGVGGRVRSDPRRGDAGSGCEDIEDRSVVGVRSTAVSVVGGTNGDGSGGGSRGGVSGVGVAVSSSDGEGDTGVHGLSNSAVDGGRVCSSERHVGNGTLSSRVLGGPLDTSNDSRVGSRSSGIEDLDGNEVDTLGDTVVGSSNGPSNVSSVSVSLYRLDFANISLSKITYIRVRGVDSVVSPSGTSSEFVVGDLDTSVDDVGSNTRSCSRVVDVASGTAGTSGDTSKTPRRSTGLSNLFVHIS
jgi:hypothetical protein